MRKDEPEIGWTWSAKKRFIHTLKATPSDVDLINALLIKIRDNLDDLTLRQPVKNAEELFGADLNGEVYSATVSGWKVFFTLNAKELWVVGVERRHG
jgi:hypothetical protein